MGRATVTVLLSLVAGFTAAQDKVYRGTDDDGTPSYSDVPPQPDSQELDIPDVNVVPGKAAEFKFDYKPRQPGVKYSSVKVTAPENDAVVYIRTTNIPISVNVVPPVRNDLGHRLQIMFDDEVLVENSSSYTLDDAFRGTHTIKARVVDKNDRVLAESDPVQVHIKKPTVLQ